MKAKIECFVFDDTTFEVQTEELIEKDWQIISMQHMGGEVYVFALLEIRNYVEPLEPWPEPGK